MKCQLKGTQFKDVMYKTWQAKNDNANRGFTEYKLGEKTITAEEQSAQVEDMLETITSYIPDIAASSIIPNAKSLDWVLEFLKEHYGYARSGKDLMLKFKTLERRPGEKMRAYWSRYIAFFEENHIKANDKLKVDGATTPVTDKLSRYGMGSELVLFLFMAHRRLPERMANILSTKLKHNDVASLKDLIQKKPKMS